MLQGRKDKIVTVKAGKNHEGYSDPTASAAVGKVSKKERKRKKKGEGRKERGKSG